MTKRANRNGDQMGWSWARGWSAYATFVERRFRAVFLAALLLTVILAFGLPRLEFSSTQDTMIPSGSQVYVENERYQQQFGGDPMLVLLEGDIRELFSAHNLAELERLESELMETGLFHAVLSPLTTLRFAADQITSGVAEELALGAVARDQEAAAQAAREEVAAQGGGAVEQEEAAAAASQATFDAFIESRIEDGRRLAEAGEQSLDNPKFTEFLVFEASGEIRSDFTGVFPDPEHALVAVRTGGNLTIDETGEAAERVVELTNQREFEGLDALPTGAALLLKELNDRMRTDMATMGAMAIVVMAVLLVLVFRARWRLLSLPLVLVGIMWAFGVMGYLGIRLTMVTISALPILIGLGVDFAVQAHARYEEDAHRDDGRTRGLRGMFEHAGPALAVAMLAAVAGFVSLRISKVPMIRDFGVMLSVGAAVLLVATLTIVPAALAWRDRRGVRPERPGGRVVERVVGVLTALTRGRPVVALVLVALAVGTGFAAQAKTPVESDPERFVPQDSPVLADLDRVREVADSSGEFGLLVEADDVLRDDVLAWMAEFEAEQLEKHEGVLFRAASVASITQLITGSTPVRDDVAAVLDIAPHGILRSFVSDDRTQAHIIFAIGPVGLAEREQLIKEIKADLAPPEGVDVIASGLSVIGIEAVKALRSNRVEMTWAGLLAVFVWLLIAFRRPVGALLTVLPVLGAVGLAALVVYLVDIEVTALGALSNGLVIAICTEFTVLVVERYLEERRKGIAPAEAMDVALGSIGRAFTASGLATAGGFAVLAASGFPLLTSFGLIVTVNVLVALVCALVMLPPLLVWADRFLGVPAASPAGAAPIGEPATIPT